LSPCLTEAKSIEMSNHSSSLLNAKQLLLGKTAVITGANRGIGKAVFESFVANGCDVFACARKIDRVFADEIVSLAEQYKVSITPVELDLMSDASIRSASKLVIDQAKQVDVLVNNAGVAQGGVFQMMSIDDMRRLFEVNLFGQLQFTQAIMRKMIRRKSGSIINLSSSVVNYADPGTLAYGASKSAFSRASESLATELGMFNIRVNSVAPGLTKTDMHNQMSDEGRQRLVARSSFKRAAAPQDVANVVMFLASELSSFVTGQTIHVDGGMV
jgi:3-oxoacyl-[acyl-carrier protein] reductase